MLRLHEKVNSTRYREIFKVKSRQKTRQVRINWSQQLKLKQVPKRMRQGVEKGQRPLLACHIHCRYSMETYITSKFVICQVLEKVMSWWNGLLSLSLVTTIRILCKFSIPGGDVYFHFEFFVCFPLLTARRTHANEIKHDHSPVQYVILYSTAYFNVCPYIFLIYYITIYIFVYHILIPLRFGLLLVLSLYKEGYLQIFKWVSFW